MVFAERAYEFGRQGKRKHESEEDRAFQLTKQRNKIFRNISTISNHKELMDVYNSLKDLVEQGYTDKQDLILLEGNIRDRISEIKKEFETKQRELIDEQEKIKREHFSESMESLSRINAESEKVLLQLLMQLSNDETKNKRIISDMMNSADRSRSLALMKLSQIEAYKALITPTMKEKLVWSSLSNEEKMWQERQNNRLAEVGKEMADITMKRFMLKKAEQVMFPKVGTYFVE